MKTPEPDSNPFRFRWMVTLGSWFTGISLVLLAIQCLVYDGAAEGYGVAPIDENGKAYLLATGMRDLALGVMTLFLLIKFRPCLPIYFLIMTIIPIADTLIVMNYGNSMASTTLHVIGIVGLLALSLLAFFENQPGPGSHG